MISLWNIAQKKDYEKTVFVLRRHWIVLAVSVLALAIEITLPVLVLLVLEPLVTDALASPVLRPLLILLGSAYALAIWVLFFHHFLDFYLDVWIVTNERLMHIEQKGFFSRVEVELRFYRIQDVASEVHGFFPTVFNYGMVHVQTAGQSERFVMKQVPRAHDVARKILHMVEYDRQFHLDREHASVH